MTMNSCYDQTWVVTIFDQFYWYNVIASSFSSSLAPNDEYLFYILSGYKIRFKKINNNNYLHASVSINETII